MPTKIDPEELVTAAEIGRRLGVSSQRAHQLTQQTRFPKPVGRIGSSDIWRWSSIARWQHERAKERWIADALALVPRTGGILQSNFRSALQNYLANSLGRTPELGNATVAQVVHAAMQGLGGTPRFDPRLLTLEWPRQPQL